jgi:hypothetical protein
MKTEIETHLAKARQIGSGRYEAEVLNTLSILYLMQGDHKISKQYLKDALEKSRSVDDADLKIKLLSNLAEECLLTWDLHEASQYLDEGVAFGKERGLNTLVMLYLYGNKIAYQIVLGQFAEAEALQSEVWKMAEDTRLLQYSKYEYFQIIFLLRNAKAVIETALGHCEASLEALQIATALVQSTNNVEYRTSAHLSQMYYELLCKKDENAARAWEAKALEASGGSWLFSTALNIAFFMMHNHKPEWARRFAQIAQDKAASDPAVSSHALGYVRQILQHEAAS